MRGYKLFPAKYAGWIVLNDYLGDNSTLREPLFAGSLDECLAFIRKRVEEEQATSTEG